jgi:hypothetical protein
MTKHVAIPVPEVPGIDLSFRPRTYFGPIPLQTHLLARVTGQERRELLRARLAAGEDDLPAELFASTLDDDVREAIGRIHPALMGGEFLPPLSDNEIEIARISLESTTARSGRVTIGTSWPTHRTRLAIFERPPWTETFANAWARTTAVTPLRRRPGDAPALDPMVRIVST